MTTPDAWEVWDDGSRLYPRMPWPASQPYSVESSYLTEGRAIRTSFDRNYIPDQGVEKTGTGNSTQWRYGGMVAFEDIENAGKIIVQAGYEPLTLNAMRWHVIDPSLVDWASTTFTNAPVGRTPWAMRFQSTTVLSNQVRVVWYDDGGGGYRYNPTLGTDWITVRAYTGILTAYTADDVFHTQGFPPPSIFPNAQPEGDYTITGEGGTTIIDAVELPSGLDPTAGGYNFAGCALHNGIVRLSWFCTEFTGPLDPFERILWATRAIDNVGGWKDPDDASWVKLGTLGAGSDILSITWTPPWPLGTQIVYLVTVTDSAAGVTTPIGEWVYDDNGDGSGGFGASDIVHYTDGSTALPVAIETDMTTIPGAVY